MEFAFIEQHASAWPVSVMFRMLGMSRSVYDDWRDQAPSARTTANRALLRDMRRLQERHQGRYGSPRLHAALRAEGHRCSRGRVERPMRRHRIRALAGCRFRPCTIDSRHYLPVAPNLLAQSFLASAPNRIWLWLADIKYIATGEGWLYLAAGRGERMAVFGRAFRLICRAAHHPTEPVQPTKLAMMQPRSQGGRCARSETSGSRRARDMPAAAMLAS